MKDFVFVYRVNNTKSLRCFHWYNSNYSEALTRFYSHVRETYGECLLDFDVTCLRSLESR